ncbi:MAG: enoyl-CoA-hydratase DpgB, partial [Gemmatimonadaceae bacterium]
MVGDTLMKAGGQSAATDRPAAHRMVEETIDATDDLARVTAALTDLCGSAEGAGGADLVVVRVTGTSRDAVWPRDVTIQSINKWERAIRRLEMLDASTVVAARGECGGATLDLLLAADHAVVTHDFMLTIPQQQQLAWPGMALYRLVQRLGLATARRLVLRPADLTAARALTLGLIDEVGDDLAALVERAH